MNLILGFVVGLLVGAGGGIYLYKTYADKLIAAAQAEVAKLTGKQ